MSLYGIAFGVGANNFQKAKEFWNKSITDKVTFGQIYSKKSTSTLTPLHEVVWKKWFFGRIILLGDSAHKVSQ